MIRTTLLAAALVSSIGAVHAALPSARPAEAPLKAEHSYIVFFTGGKSDLTPEAKAVLRLAAGQAHSMPMARIRVTLPVGPGSLPSLARNRARAVKAELVRNGVEARAIASENETQTLTPVSDLSAWRDRSATVEAMPMPNSASAGQVG